MRSVHEGEGGALGMVESRSIFATATCRDREENAGGPIVRNRRTHLARLASGGTDTLDLHSQVVDSHLETQVRKSLNYPFSDSFFPGGCPMVASGSGPVRDLSGSDPGAR